MFRTVQVKMDRRDRRLSVKPLIFFVSISHSLFYEQGSGDQLKSIKIILGSASGRVVTT
jgi:hypothetical protein